MKNESNDEERVCGTGRLEIGIKVTKLSKKYGCNRQRVSVRMLS